MKAFLKNISLSVVALLTIVFCLEIVLRGMGYETYQSERNDSDYIQPDSILNYKYIPNLDVEINTEDYSTHVSTNSFGYRDKEWVFPNQHQKILVVGNSFSAGFGLPVEKRWSNLLQEKLRDQQQSYTVYNAAISGYSLQQAINTATFLVPKIDPDIIIVGVFINDLNRLENPYLYHEGYSVKRNMINRTLSYKNQLFVLHSENDFLKSIEAVFYNYSALYNFVVEKLHNIKARFFKPTQNDFTSLTNKANQLLWSFNTRLKNEEKKLIILPIIIHDKNQKFSESSLDSYQAIKSFSEQNEISFTDIYPKLKQEVDSGADFWINDDSHWNEKANFIASELLLLEVLE